jgi:2-oxoisovalerate dehydrogenase E2 component (dihydrolipoyl transacylase)
MAVHVIRMPDLGEGIAEVELVAWRVAPGDAVAEDQVLADVMTDKATVEIPSSVAGTVIALGGEVGQTLAVGAELIRIEHAGEGGSEPVAAGSTRPAAPAEAAAAAARPPADAPAIALAASPAFGAAAPARNGDAAAVRPIASPAVRARAWELGIDLASVAASGPAGRIVQADLDAHVARRGPAAPGNPPSTMPSPSAPSPMRPALAPRPPPASPPPGSDATHAVRIIGLRRKIAQRMQESKRRIPHYTYVEEIDVTELEDLRAALDATHGAERGKPTLLAYLVRATVRAVRAFPQVNARLDDEAGVLTVHDAVHVGIATQTDAGLMVPVLRDAGALDLWQVAAEIRRLAEAARSGTIVRDELSGSTLTITSLGKLGGIVTTPVINHPEVAIVGVNRIAVRPMIRDGAVVARKMMNLSSSFDHRVVDGAYGAGFVQRLRAYLEHPATLFVD